MYLILVIAHTGQGKTTFVKNYINKAEKCLVFDVNNEYKDLPFDEEADKSRFIGDYREFVDLVNTKTNTVCVFEEATGFFKGRISQNMTKAIIAKRHTGNQFVFLFHSIQRTPKELFELSNFIVLFKTNDIYNDVKAKAPMILNQFTQLQNMPKFSKKIIKTI